MEKSNDLPKVIQTANGEVLPQMQVYLNPEPRLLILLTLSSWARLSLQTAGFPTLSSKLIDQLPSRHEHIIQQSDKNYGAPHLQKTGSWGGGVRSHGDEKGAALSFRKTSLHSYFSNA